MVHEKISLHDCNLDLMGATMAFIVTKRLGLWTGMKSKIFRAQYPGVACYQVNSPVKQLYR